MKCIIPANHVKLFAKSIHCLAKLGSEIYLDCLEDELEMKTVNASRSTYACFLFPKTFFVEYESLPIYEEENELLRCKISVKTFLQVFRSVTFIERSVETCEIALSSDSCHLVFTLKCKHTIVKTYQLNFQECESLKAVYAKDLCPNKLTAPWKLLVDVMVNFPSSLEEICLSVDPCKVSISNFTDEEEVGKVMSTEMNLHPEEFQYFQIGVDTKIAFCLKDLRAILSFAESCNSEFNMNFEYGGKPLVLSLGLEGVLNANFVLATICDDTQASEGSVSVNVNPSVQIREKKRQNMAERQGVEKRKKLNNGAGNGAQTADHPVDLTCDDSTFNITGASYTSQNKTRSKHGLNATHTEQNNNSEAHYLHVNDVFFNRGQCGPSVDNTILAADSDEET